MRCILVIGKADLGKALQDCLEKNGYKVILASEPYQAMAIMDGERRIDFVLLAGLDCERCYEFALVKCGTSNVMILTDATEIVKEMKLRGVTTFEKHVSFNVLVASIREACPP